MKVLLENYGFDVIDLGKDVPPEAIVEKAVEENVTLVGLSALMTTTVVSMEETIKLLREKKPDCKVMVGGAVLNQDYADMIGADFYGKRCHAVRTLCAEIFWHGGVGTARQIQRSKLYVKMLKSLENFFVYAIICINQGEKKMIAWEA
ncbi:MAG: cobalamin-dependent protein [Coprococcus sp.]